jgi:TP901-1 family phage major tail protein
MSDLKSNSHLPDRAGGGRVTLLRGRRCSNCRRSGQKYHQHGDFLSPDRVVLKPETVIMPAEKGSAFLLKVGDGAEPPVYATIAGLRTTQLSINGDAVVITNKGSGAWRELLSGAGVRSVSVSGAGVFTGSTAETRIKNNALSGALDDYELSFESGERMRGKFLVARLDYAGDFNGERSYTLALESSGQVVTL